MPSSLLKYWHPSPSLQPAWLHYDTSGERSGSPHSQPPAYFEFACTYMYMRFVQTYLHYEGFSFNAWWHLDLTAVPFLTNEVVNVVIYTLKWRQRSKGEFREKFTESNKGTQKKLPQLHAALDRFPKQFKLNWLQTTCARWSMLKSGSGLWVNGLTQVWSKAV